MIKIVVASIMLFVSFGSPIAWAQSTQESDAPAVAQTRKDTPPYEDRLHRIAELVGSLHYLSTLCGTDKNSDFRSKMQEIIQAETIDEPARSRQLVARYNKGYRAFSSVYKTCTSAARVAQSSYREEGQLVIKELLTRYSNK